MGEARALIAHACGPDCTVNGRGCVARTEDDERSVSRCHSRSRSASNKKNIKVTERSVLPFVLHMSVIRAGRL